MSELTVNTFPKNRVEALTMLYLQDKDLSNLTPRELANKYKEVYSVIQDSFKSGNSQQVNY